FEPKFASHTFGHAEFSEDGQVKVDETRTTENITRCSAVGSWGRRRKCSDVEPLLTRSDIPQHLGRADQIGPIAITRRVEAGAADSNIQWLAGIGGENAVKLPIAQDPATDA